MVLVDGGTRPPAIPWPHRRSNQRAFPQRAEMVASFARGNRLATLVGTRTAGEVLGGANFKLPAGYVLRMPVAGWYTWNGGMHRGQGSRTRCRLLENTPELLASGIDAQLQKSVRGSHNTLESNILLP